MPGRNQAARRVVRVFISSPSDVRPERGLLRRVIARLGREFTHHFDVEAILWEREPLLASASFQQGITPPHTTDIVVVVLWSRLGVPLSGARWLGPLSGREVTGTEWEFEDALAGYKRTGSQPELLLYRKTASIDVRLTSEADVLARLRQKELVDDFVRRWTRDADGKAFTAASWSFADGAALEDMVEGHLRALLQKRLGAGVGELAGGRIWHEAPYRGLEAFEPEHEQIFFGRTRARNELRELLARQAARGTAFVLVVGASGSGKSSLVKAGLVPDLAEAGLIGRVALVRTAIVRRPGAAADPLSSLSEALMAPGALPELGIAPLIYTAAQLAALLRDAPVQAAQPIRQGLSVAGGQAGLTAAGEARLLLVIDQLEELFTAEAIEASARERFVAALEALAKSGLVWVVATLRSDFFNRLDQVPALARLSEGEGRYLLLPPTAGEIGQIVRQPAREAGLRFEVDPATGEPLDEVIIGAAALGTGSLPLLEYLLGQLWQRRDAAGVLSYAAYRALGGLEGAIGARAEEVLTAQPAEVRAELPRVLRALVTVGQGATATATARNADIAQFVAGTPERRLVDAMLATDARLLVADGGNVRVAHEALLRHWERARQQLVEDRADLQLRARLDEAQSRWRTTADADRDSLLLPPGRPLAEARDLVRRRGSELSSQVTEYVSESAEADDARRDAALRAAQAVAAERTMAAETAEKLAKEARQANERLTAERNAALRAQSRYVVQAGKALSDAGDYGTALALALEMLPDRLPHGDRPYEAAAEGLALKALHYLLEMAVLRGHGDGVWRAAFSPNGLQVVTASEDGTARIWDASTRREVAVLRGHDGYTRSAHFSPDGSWVVTSDDSTARLWDAATGHETVRFRGHQDTVFSAAFSPDGRWIVSASWDRTARLWEAETGHELALLSGHKDGVRSATFSRDGRRILTWSDDRTARVWRTDTGDELVVLRGHERALWSATFSPDGRLVVTSSEDSTARVWESETGSEVAVLRGHESTVGSATFSPNGLWVLTASDDRTARVWEAETGKEISVLRGHEGLVRSAAFSPDGRQVLTASWDHTARRWEAETGRQVAVFRGHEGKVFSAKFSPDGLRVVTASDDMTARLWDSGVRSTVSVLRGHEREVLNASFAPDGRYAVTASEDGTARVWEVDKCEEVTMLSGHRDWVRSANFSPDGRWVVTASDDMTARVWEAGTGRQLTLLSGHADCVRSAAFSHNGSLVVTASKDGTARVWEAATGRESAVLNGHEGNVWNAAFSRDGRRIVTWGDRTARLWEPSSGREVAVFRHENLVSSAIFSPDGRQLATTCWDGTARLWQEANEELCTVFRGHRSMIWHAAFSPDGRWMATASQDRTARLWETATGREAAMLRAHEGDIQSVTFSPDGKWVVTASDDRSVRLWEAETGNEVMELRRFEDRVRSASYSPDGRWLMIVSGSGAHICRIRQDQELLEYACQLMPRPLTYAQREQYFLERCPENPRCGRRPWP